MSKKPEKIKITTIKPTSVAGRAIEAGKTWEAKADEAKALIAAQKAKPVDEISAEDKAAIAEFEARLKGKHRSEKDEPEKKSGSGGDDEGDDIEQLTVQQLKDVLETSEIDYDSRANKAQLVELVRAIEV